MIAPRALLRIAAAAAGLMLLSGCISVLPKSKPTQLYRLDAAAAPTRATPVDGRKVSVLKTDTSFERAIGGDRILTVSGDKAAFLAETRWTAPAAVLFDEAVARAFDGEGGVVRLATRSEASKAAYILRIDVRDFAAVYLAGPKAAPTIVVRMRASLIHSGDRRLAGERMFEAQVLASDNRVGAIIEAFNEAVARTLTELVAWTDATATPV